MKVIFLGALHTTDCEFPLIREYQRMATEVIYYLPVSKYVHNAGLIEIKRELPKTGIYPASDFPEFACYSSYMDLSRVFIIVNPNTHQNLFKGQLLWLKVYLHIRKQHADILHIAWPLMQTSKILYHLPLKKILLVHDPIPHSNLDDKEHEAPRIEAFNKCDVLALFNSAQKKAFMDRYGIGEDRIIINHLGEYNAMREMNYPSYPSSSKYILFFGYISGYKGLEYLCEAMPEIHKKHPDIKLVVAGGGKIYFDWEPYKNLDYIELHNQFLSLEELAGYLKGCMFSVCPYKDATQSGVVQTAFSMGVPMVVTNVGALPKAVTDGETGLVIPPCNVDAIVEACDKLLSNPELLKNMRQNIVNKWQKSMSWEPIAEKYIECYKSLIDNRDNG